MKKTFKITAIVFLIILLLLLIPVGILISVDLNQYKDLISGRVKQQTGRELVLSGSIEKTFFPWLGVKLGAMQFSNASGFGDVPFAKLDKAEVRVKLLPLFKKEVVVDKVVLHGLQLHLARNPAGDTNWDDLMSKSVVEQDAAGSADSKTQAEPTAPAKPADTPPHTAPMPLAALTVGGVDIREAQVVWDDRQAQQRYELSKINLQTGGVAMDQPVDVQLALNFAVSQPQLSGVMEFSAVVTAEVAQQRYSIQDMDLKTEVSGEPIPLQTLPLRLNANVITDLSNQTAEISALQVNSMGANASGEASAQQIMGDPNAQVQIKVNVNDHQKLYQALQTLLPPQLNQDWLQHAHLAFNADVSLEKQTARLKPIEGGLSGLNFNGELSARQLLEQPEMQTSLTIKVVDHQQLGQSMRSLLPPDFKSELLKDAKVAVNAAASLRNQTAQLKPVKVSIAGLNVNAGFEAESIVDNPAFKGTLRIPAFNPRETLLSAGIELPAMADNKTLGNASLSADYHGNTDQISIKTMQLTLDDTQVNGSLAVAQFSQPSIRYDLAVDQIDLDRYMPPEENQAAKLTAAKPGVSTEKPDNQAEEISQDPELPIPAELLRTLNIDGKLRMGKLTAKNLKIANLEVGVAAKKGLIKVPMQAKLYKGSSKGEVQLDVRQALPRFVIHEEMAGVHFGPLLQDFMQEDYVSGVANITAKLTTRGSKVSELKQNLNGNTKFDFRHGRIKYLDLADILLTDYAKYLRMALEDRQPDITTVFKEFNGSTSIKNAVVHNNDLYLRSSRFDVKGEGSVDLVKETIAYTAYTEIINPTGGMKKVGLHKLQGIPIPVHFRGTFSQPEYNVDWEKPIKEATSRRIKKEQEKLKKQAKERLDKEKKKLQEKAKKQSQQELDKLEEKSKKEVDKLEQKLKEKFRKIF